MVIYDEELAHTIMEPEKFHNLQVGDPGKLVA